MAGDLESLISALAALPEHRRRAIRIPIHVAQRVLEAVPRRSLKESLAGLSIPSAPAGGARNPQPSAVQALPVKPPPPASSSPPPHTLPVPAADRAGRLAALRQTVLSCVLCPHLAATRKNVVFGSGNPEAELMFVGEAPGADEDAQGEPFVGAAGKLLGRIIEAMELSREAVYIANVLKCRPDMPAGSSGNRPPTSVEMATCLPYLLEQIKIIAPRCIVALGSTAVCGLFGLPEVKMGALRGRWRLLELPPAAKDGVADLSVGVPCAIPVMVTYHPAYLLRNQSISEKRKVWEDMIAVLEHLGHPVSARQRAYFVQPAPR